MWREQHKWQLRRSINFRCESMFRKQFFQNQKLTNCACLEEEPGLAPPVGTEDCGEHAGPGAPTLKQKLLTAFEEVSRLKLHAPNIPNVVLKVSMFCLRDIASLRLVRMKTMGISSGAAMDLLLKSS